MTVDEELGVLESQLRRLKIEYEIFFSNPKKKPPSDLEWKVLALLRKFSDGGRMNFSQRFRYNAIAQRYAIYSDLWRKKSRIREEGYRRPQDALLSVQGVRPDVEAHKPHHNPVYGLSHTAAAAAAAAVEAPAPRSRLHCTALRIKQSANRWNDCSTLWSRLRIRREKKSPATLIPFPGSCRRRPKRSGSSTAARMWSSPWS